MKFDKAYKWLVTLLLGVATYCFWAFQYRSALSHQEQLQLFLTDGQYLLDHLLWPGGFVTYLAEYLTQTYNNFWIGAAVIAFMMMGIQWLTYQLTRKIKPEACSSLVYSLSLLPAALIWLYMGDVNTMPSLILAILITIVIGLAICRIKSLMLLLISTVIVLPLHYWLFGTSVYMLAVIIGVAICSSKTNMLIKIAYWPLVAVYVTSLIYVASQWVNYTVDQQFIGINFYRVPLVMPLMQAIVLLIVPLTSVISILVMRIKAAWLTKMPAAIAAALLIGGVSYAFMGKCYDAKTYELVEYDYLVRINNWPAIVAKAEKQHPDLPMSVCATNLALGMTNQLDVRAFEFFQNGIDGLFPPFQRETAPTLVTAELFYQLGLVNTAQRFTFEAMEAIPNYNKSARCVKRLAETNLIRGNYDVAMKYLKLLEKTTVYKKWAQRTMQLVQNPQSIDMHPLYGRIRHLQVDDEYMFSQYELDKTMGQLYLKDINNNLAKQYLVLSPLLQRDINKFMQYMDVVQQKGRYMPLLCQQGVAFAYIKAGQEPPAGLVDPMVLQQLRQFAQIWTKEGADSKALNQYSNTLWYYLVKGN